MIEIIEDPARVIIPVNENIVNKTIYIASKVRSESISNATVIAFAVKRKSGWTWLFATPESCSCKFYSKISLNINNMLSEEFRYFRGHGVQITILENNQELLDYLHQYNINSKFQTYLRTYDIDEHFQQLLEVPWSYL